MKAPEKFLTISDNKRKIEELLYDLVLMPRIKALDWSQVTKQTPNMKIGYPGQHLASLITGVEGARTGARGDDLLDGTEVKTCSRVDQLDTCKKCKNKVLRIELICPHCGSDEIKRMNDSKWLFAVKSEEELKLLTEDIDRVFVSIADYPNFDDGDFDTIRFQAFEIWNRTDRHQKFGHLMSNYYHKIFLDHIKRNPRKTPAPKNFWPYSFQFYLCNPVKVFNCIVTNANTQPKLNVDFLVSPELDRSCLNPEPMPIQLLKENELNQLLEAPRSVIEPLLQHGSYKEIEQLIRSNATSKSLVKRLPVLNEEARSYLSLRDTDIASVAKSKYSRRG